MLGTGLFVALFVGSAWAWNSDGDRHVKFTFGGPMETGPSTPSPLLNFTASCGGWSAGRVCDPYHRLTQDERREIANLTLHFDLHTPCGCYERFCLAPGTHHGYHIAVVVTKTVETAESGQRLADKLLKAYAKDLQVPEPRDVEKEKLTDGPIFGYCFDQTLILLTRSDAFISRAYKVRGRVSRKQATEVVADAGRKIRSGDYAGALRQMILGMQDLVNQSHVTDTSPWLATGLLVIILSLTLGVWLWVACQEVNCRRKGSRCFKSCGAKPPAPRRKFTMNFRVNADDFVEIDWRRHRENTAGGLQDSFLIPANHFTQAKK